MAKRISIGRRGFLRAAAGAGIAGGLSAIPLPACATGTTSARRRPEVVAIYFPGFHRYDHMDSWRGYGWCEWELVKTAPARFAGHHQPLRPSWGFFDESDPAWSAREIALAAEHHVDVFLFDWYWYSGVRLMEEALERGFLKAPNRDSLRFALMWANHNWGDYFPVRYDKPFPIWLPQRHSPADLERMIDYCIDHYFRQPNYWKVDGKLFLSVFSPGTLIQQLGGPAKTKALLAGLDLRLHRAGLPPIHWSGMGGNVHTASYGDAGFQSISSYNISNTGKTAPRLTQEYDDLIATHAQTWKRKAEGPLCHFPNVTMGWDVTPRCEHQVPFPFAKQNYPYGHVVLGNTPERFGKLCKQAAEFVAADPKQPAAVVVNAWNEWTEGSYLLPEEKHGVAYLKALREALGK